jgi:glycosyltransferase involved in cell wall biosynthesis
MISPHLSIVVPLYNEEESIELLIERISTVMERNRIKYELILVDDGSKDSTWKKIEALKGLHPNLRGIKFRRNFGQTAAMVAGFDHARGELIVTLDGDLQNDPADIPRLIQKLEEGYDIVSGWRRDRQDHILRVIPSRIANAIISRTTGVHLHDYGCSLKVYRADIIRSLNAYGEMHRFFPALASMTGATVAEIPVKHHPRRYGTSKYGFERIFKVFTDIFSMNLIIRFSSTPLVGFTIFSLPFAGLAAVFTLLSLLAEISGWTTGKAGFFAILMLLNLMAVILLNLFGILAELVVSNSDLSHTELPMLKRENIQFPQRGTRDLQD